MIIAASEQKDRCAQLGNERREREQRLGPIERLQSGSREVRKWWPEHEVTPPGSGTKRIRRPELGVFNFRHVVLQVADDPNQKLVTFTCGSPDGARLARLIG